MLLEPRFDQFFTLAAILPNPQPAIGAELRIQTEVTLWQRDVPRRAAPQRSVRPGLPAGHAANGTGGSAPVPIAANAQELQWQPFGGEGSAARAHVHERTVVCRAGQAWCEPLLLAQQGSILRRLELRANLKLGSAPSAPAGEASGLPRGNVVMQVGSRCSQFGRFEAAFKLSLLAASLAVLCAYAGRLLRVPAAERTLTQSWVGLLLAFTPALDDAALVLQAVPALRGVLLRVVSTALQGSSLAVLLLFWLVTLGAVTRPPSRVGTLAFYLPKVLLCAAIWTSTAGGYAWDTWQAALEPTAPAVPANAAALAAVRALASGHAVELSAPALLGAVSLGLCAVYALWLLAILVRTLPEVFTQSSSQTVAFFFSLAVLACTLSALVLGALAPTHDQVHTAATRRRTRAPTPPALTL